MPPNGNARHSDPLEVLATVAAHERAVLPPVREQQGLLDYPSTSGPQRWMNKLAELGYVTQEAGFHSRWTLAQLGRSSMRDYRASGATMLTGKTCACACGEVDHFIQEQTA